MSFTSPLGPLRLVAEDGALVGVYFQDHRPAPRPAHGDSDAAGAGDASGGGAEEAVLQEAARQLGEYFRGERRAFALPLRPSGSPFQRAVWGRLAAIPFGETRSYGALALELGRPEAVRAVGAANGRNPLSIVLPCHRVIGAGGDLTGYAGGLERKRWLLAHEGKEPRRGPLQGRLALAL